MALDLKFFRKAKKVNRAIEITDTEAVIPAVRDSAEIRVPLPNRRIKTFEERSQIIEGRREQIATLEEDIEVQRKKLLDLVKTYRAVGTGVAEIVAQNIKIKEIMERRSALHYPEIWIEELKGLTLKDVFESKRDTRKIGKNVAVYQVKHRVEPIRSLYVDVGAAAGVAAVAAEAAAATAVAPGVATTVATAVAAPVAPGATAATAAAATAAAATAAKGAIIGKKLAIKIKKTPAAGL